MRIERDAMGPGELNLMMPLMAYDLLRSIEWLVNGVYAFADRCVVGIEANEERCREMVERSLALVTALAPVIGHAAAEIAKEAHRTARTVRDVAEEHGVLSPEELNKVLDPYRMTEPGRPDDVD